MPRRPAIRMMAPMHTISTLVTALLIAVPAVLGLLGLVAMVGAATLWVTGAEGDTDLDGTPLVIRGPLAPAR